MYLNNSVFISNMSIDNVSKDIIENIFQPLVKCETEKETILNKVKSNAAQFGKFKILIEQAAFIKKQLQEVINESLLNVNLHAVKCGFSKVSGNTYYLYKKDDYFFSILSPTDWKNSPPYDFIGSYYFDYDKSFTRLDV